MGGREPYSSLIFQAWVQDAVLACLRHADVICWARTRRDGMGAKLANGGLRCTTLSLYSEHLPYALTTFAVQDVQLFESACAGFTMWVMAACAAAQMPRLRVLRLENDTMTKFSPTQALAVSRPLGDALSRLTLREVSLQMPSPVAMPAVLQRLKGNPNLERLTLHNVDWVSPESFQVVQAAVAAQRGLRVLSLHYPRKLGGQPSPCQLGALVSSLAETGTLASLKLLAGAPLAPAHLAACAPGLRKLERLHFLDLSLNDGILDGCIAPDTLAPFPAQIRTLRLNACSLCSRLALQRLADVLRALPNLEELGLCSNRMWVDGLGVIVGALANTHHLTRFDVEKSDLGPQSVNPLCWLISTKTNLVWLDLGHNYFGSSVLHLLDPLVSLPRLMCVWLSHLSLDQAQVMGATLGTKMRIVD